MLGFFDAFSRIELLMDSKVVGESSGPLGREGKEIFNIDMSTTGVGQHKLQARGTFGPRLFRGLFERTAASPEIIITVDCNTDNSFLYFTGRDEVSSINTGKINVTWTPALAFGLAEEQFIWCGAVKYNVFIAEGSYDFSQVNATGPGLLTLSKLLPKLRRLETTALSLEISDVSPGAEYSVLVIARTELGLFSHNRDYAAISVATTSPIVKSSFTRMAIIAEPTDSLQIETQAGDNRVSFKGALPDSVLDLRPLDFVYFSTRAAMPQWPSS
jgi:hypothetical protein